MRWLMMVALVGCGSAEIATADPTRCSLQHFEFGSSMDECCAAAAKQDCRAGFLAVEALYGPAGADTTEEYDTFASDCNISHHIDVEYSYCVAYCSVPQCSDYTSVDAQMWAGDAGVAVQPYQDCDCRLDYASF